MMCALCACANADVENAGLTDRDDELDVSVYEDSEGISLFKLDDWEKKVLDAEMKKEGFVCWIRNEKRLLYV